MSERSALHDVVLGASRRTPRRLALFAGSAALLLHLGGAVVAVAFAHTESAPKRPSKPLVVFEHVIELPPDPPAPIPPPATPEAPPPPAPPPPKAEPVRVKPKAQPVAEAAPTPAPPPAATPPVEPPPVPSEPPPAAQAGQVVAAAENAQPNAQSFQIATGAGQGYAGGTTSSHGTGREANHTGQVGDGRGQGLGRARGALLRTKNPPCGWPTEAEELDLEEAFVTLQASVGSDGAVVDVKVLADPGYGFGKRAAACARSKMKFEPALDDAGRPIASVTGPVRVRFVRED